MYNYQIVHKRSTDHINVDALSRLPLSETIMSTPLPSETVLLMEQLDDGVVTAGMVCAWTRKDPILSRVTQYVLSGWPSTMTDQSLQPFWSKQTELTSQDGCLLWGNRVVVPEAGRSLMLRELHDSHPGATRMKRIARTLVWWPGIGKEIEQTVKNCHLCQAQQSSPPVIPLQPWTWPTRPWSRVHIDFVGPFLNHMFLILIDAHSKWIEAHPLPSIESTPTIQCLTL